jgi:heat shock protein HslJ
MGTRSHVTAVAALLLVAFVVSGCGNKYGRSEASGLAFTPSLADLHGHPWTTDTIIDPHRSLVPGSTITMHFTENSISANAGCNTIFGGAKVNHTKLAVAQLASTQKGCVQPLAAQDVWLSAFLSAHPVIERLDGDLWLSRKDTVVHLTQQDG